MKIREKSRSFKYLSKLSGLSVVTAKPKDVPSSPAGSTSPEMDPGIWSRLPPELLDHVLSFLPLRTCFNLRSTCKHFDSLLYSPSFVSKHSDSSFSSFLLLAHPQCFRQLPLYDSALGTWRSLPLSVSVSLPSGIPSTALVSTANGLVCFSLRNSCSFVVCNLLTKSSRLIEFPYHPFAFELLTLVSVPLGYKIFTLFSGSSPVSALVFDSRDHSWRRFDNFAPIHGDNHRQEAACYNARLYFVTPEPFSIVTFDLENGEWEETDIVMPEDLTFVRLVSDGDRKLYMIGGIGRNGISRSLKLWEFSEQRNWVEIENVPQMICKKFMSICYHNYKHVYCFWHQGTICLCCHTWPEILYYKLSRRTWHWLPKCPSLPERWSCGFRWFSFVPELYASA
ncbi:F-box/kelch-repeat protein At5g43190 [Cucurbita pepo subsp. pepo]|uniref:F-box/kelch-repeat protein At5g43190 n=1 Tax=Cucurbita pepo subsp. pepo TaxID=3664 RepID=UPI000C9D4F0D|nr:F-box/kelch-repeat protein At5g43190 [Cucurbita pepo subsp. pepo]